jgi:hypothetical protein
MATGAENRGVDDDFGLRAGLLLVVDSEGVDGLVDEGRPSS